jgi:hypothetical protein
VTKDKGQALVEVCITLPVFLLIFILILQLVFIITTTLVVNYACYAGARAAIVAEKYDDAVSNAKKAARFVLTSLSIPSSLLSEINVRKEGKEYVVEIKYPLKLIMKSFIPIRIIKGNCRLVSENE